MGSTISKLFGSSDNGATELAQRQLAASQRMALAERARAEATVDQAGATTSTARKGRRLLTYLGADGAGLPQGDQERLQSVHAREGDRRADHLHGHEQGRGLAQEFEPLAALGRIAAGSASAPGT